MLRPVFDDDQLFKTIADTRKMMLAATYAKSIGRTVAFSLAAFRQVFNAAKPVDKEDTILIAAAACEMHPRAVLRRSTWSRPASLEGCRQRAAEARRRSHRAAGADRHRADGTEVNACEDDLFALALREFAALKPAQPRRARRPAALIERRVL